MKALNGQILVPIPSIRSNRHLDENYSHIRNHQYQLPPEVKLYKIVKTHLFMKRAKRRLIVGKRAILYTVLSV